jgi:hypothetical protein
VNATAREADLIRVVLADANVRYSPVLRDYLLYAADQEIIAITWSRQILAEVSEHLIKNVPGFDRVRGVPVMMGGMPRTVGGRCPLRVRTARTRCAGPPG